jgi:hypothetical protein
MKTMIKKRAISFGLILILCLLTSACQATWKIDISNDDLPARSVGAKDVEFYVDKLDAEAEEILLAPILFQNGFTLIDQISLYQDDTLIKTYDWESIAEKALISSIGQITVDDETFTPTTVDIKPAPLAVDIELSIMDLAPTIAQVLNLPPLPEALGKPRYDGNTNHAVMILVDGLQYQKLQTMIAEGKLPFFQAIPKINQGLTIYPSITTASTAALLTSSPPWVNGVYGYGYRSTEVMTLFDLATEHGLSVTAVEGYSLAFNLRSAEVILSGDRDGDGYTDDNVLSNSLDVIQSNMPDLLFIHLHDVDDMGHGFGPDSHEYESAIIRVDDYLNQIYESLPENTFITIFADHGMQDDPYSSGGNHGQLTQLSMVIPIIFIEK